MYKALKTAQNDIHTALLKFTDDIVEVQQSKSSESGDSSVLESVQLLQAKQDVQFRVLNGAIENLNENMAKIVTLLSERIDTVSTSLRIPILQPAASTDDMKEVVASAPVLNVAPVVAPVVAPLDDSLSEIDVEEEEEEEIEVEDEDLEVDEWTYKGRSFFKDTNNTVYANESGEVGDAIGTYDPVKNILKKLS